jgi:signal transduction histidine kinase/PAS domain-containing protein
MEEPVSGVWPGASLPNVSALDKLARAALGATGASDVWIALARPDAPHGELAPVVGVSARPTGVMALEPASAPPAVRQVMSRASQTGERLSIQSAAVAKDPRAQGEQGPQWGAIMCALAYESERPVGALVMVSARPEPFASAQRELALLYASQIATTIRLVEGAALHEAQARELAALLDATRALTSGLDAQGVINSIASHITRVIACDAALIYRFDARARALRLVAGLGVDVERLAGAVISIQDQRSLAARVASAGAPRYNVILRPEEQAGALTGALATNGAVSLVCEPLIAQGRLLGVMMLARVRVFDEGEQRALGRFAAIAAVALERAGLYEEMRAQRDQREAMFASASDGFALIGGDLRFIEVNHAFASYLGREPEALRGLNCCQALNGTPGAPPSMESCLLCHGPCRAMACMEGGEAIAPFEGVFPAARTPARTGPPASAGPQPNNRVISFTMTPITGSGGLRALLVGRDISVEREMERSRMDFLNMAAHELRQPLQTIQTNLELVLGHASSRLTPEERRRYEMAALTASLHAGARVADLVSLSQRDSGQLAIHPAPGDLAEVARGVAAELRAMAAGYDVRLEAPASEGLPLALIDGDRASQVARNLLINALRFTPTGGWTRIATRVGDYKGRRWAILEVTDSGVGIPEGSRERIFERRYQAPTPEMRGRPKGSGLGLAIVRYIMDGHGGDFRVESEPGKGSRFIMFFPLA